jgi:hypothetical protein
METSFVIYLLLVLACLIAYLQNKQGLPIFFKYFQYLLTFILIFEYSQENFNLPQKISFLLDHIYEPIEFTLLSLIYNKAIHNKKIKKFIFINIFIYILIAFVFSGIIEGVGNVNTFSFLISSTLLILYSIFYFYELFLRPQLEDSLFKTPFFWINTGTLFYCGGTFFQMGIHSYLLSNNSSLADSLKVISQFFNYLLYTLYLIGFLCRTRLHN